MPLNILVVRHHTPNIYQPKTDYDYVNYWCTKSREFLPREIARLPEIRIITPDDLALKRMISSVKVLI